MSFCTDHTIPYHTCVVQYIVVRDSPYLSVSCLTVLYRTITTPLPHPTTTLPYHTLPHHTAIPHHTTPHRYTTPHHTTPLYHTTPYHSAQIPHPNEYSNVLELALLVIFIPAKPTQFKLLLMSPHDSMSSRFSSPSPHMSNAKAWSKLVPNSQSPMSMFDDARPFGRALISGRC